MSHFADFMEDVSVKISEKYKRFPKIYLPYTVNECITRAQSVVDSANAPTYSCTFERNVLTKLKELRNAKETKKNERRHRLQLLQEAEQKRLDAIAAAEEEERLKQLSVSEVSYPSTEEISAPSPDVKADLNCDNNTNDVTPEKIDESTSINLSVASAHNETQINILQPTLVSSHYPENNLLDDPDPLQNFKLNNKITKIAHNPNIDNLTFRDFENDTSSPFDNVELKTINDMELLAQVLQSQKDSTISCHQQPGYVTEQSYSIPSCATQAQLEGTNYLPATYLEQPIQGHSMMYNTPQHYPISNGYYIPTDAENINLYMPDYSYYVPTNRYGEMEPYYSGQLTMTSNFNQPGNDSAYIQPQFYYQYPNMPVQYQPADATVLNNKIPNENTELNLTTTSQNAIKSRSRSVPDIVRELNEELAKLKMIERSCNASPAPKNVQESQPQPSTANGRKTERMSKKKSVHLPNPFDKLHSKVQDICRKIHGMGFPLDRVARVCTLVGENDKKIIEALLILGDLMDLGFPEDKVSAALAKHQFNRDKALDELVS